ncbi:MAG: DUF1987 domain-containing protein [Flavobacteriales bacterium]
MEALQIKGDFYSPDIELDPDIGVFSMSGNAILSNPVDFFEPIIEWMHEYANNPRELTDVTINLKYCNTSSSRSLMEFLRVLESIQNGGKGQVKIKWIYDPEDEDLFETGENFSDIVDIPFELVAESSPL